MKRARIIGMMSIGLLVIVVALLSAMMPSAQAAGELGLSARSVALEPAAGVTCAVTISTTNNFTNVDFGSAILLPTSSQYALIPTTPYTSGAAIPRATIDSYFKANVLSGYQVTIRAIPQNSGGNYNLGMDIYDASHTLIAQNVNPADNFEASFTRVFTSGGQIFVKVYEIGNELSCIGGYFTVEYIHIAPTATSTLTPTPTPTNTPTKTITPTPGAFACTTGSDKFEPNNDYDTATTIGLGVKYASLNFVECVQSDDSWDNDYFKARVKPGMLVTCRTLDLTPGTDTNLILYDVKRNGITGQDDFNRAAGDLSSSVSYYVTYEGWLYGLVGEGFHRPQSEQAGASYSYECTIQSQYTPTPSATPTYAPGVPTNTPIPPTLTPSLTPSPTLSPTPPFIKIVPLPTVTPAGLPGKSIPVSLQVYYDTDSNNKPDPGEGVVGVSARVFDLTDGNLLAQSLTDQTGRVNFTVTAAGAVQLVVPYFNFSTIILPASGGSAVIRISPHELPRSIP